jgi:c-di-GMP-binding flagellar brake protein YcgR
MPDTFIQNITEAGTILGILREAIDSRTVCTITFAETENTWISSLLDIVVRDGSPKILIDKVKGFETVLARNPQGELSLEFRDKKEIPCLFDAAVVELPPKGILLDFPQRLQRVQRREYFRVEAPIGAEITFLGASADKEQGVLSDLGGGGAAILIPKESPIQVGDLLENVWIQLPTEKVQRREYFRIGTPEGATISFGESFAKTETGRLMDIGGGGAAFLAGRNPSLQVEKVLKNIRIQVPMGNRSFSVETSEAVVRWCQDRLGGGIVVGIEFDEMAEKVRREIIDYIYERQRNALFMEITKAVVRRVQKRDDDRMVIGIEFTEISERVRKDLIAYIFERQRSTIRKIGR